MDAKLSLYLASLPHSR